MFKSISNWLQNRRRKKELAKAPKCLSEALETLHNNVSENDKREFADKSRSSACVGLGFGAGMAMRNGWGLWQKNQPLTQWFRKHGIWHADDMSGAIYTAFWCELNKVPFDIEAEKKFYDAHWAKYGQGFDGKPLTDSDPYRRQSDVPNKGISVIVDTRTGGTEIVDNANRPQKT